MRALGPTWAVVLTLDAHLLVALALANLGFAASTVLLVFRRRRALDRVLIGLGVFFAVMLGSLAGMYLFAGAPIREAQVLVLD